MVLCFVSIVASFFAVTQVPLVQQIYDELRTMADAEREAKMGADSPVLAKVRARHASADGLA